jgi:hypothetical protein
VLGTQETLCIIIAGLLERDSFDLFLPEFDKPLVIHLRETCCCSINLCTWRPNTVYKDRSVHRHQLFTNYTAGDFGVMKMGNNDRAQIIGRGDVHLEIENGTTLVLKSVRHVEALWLNIISARLLDKDGYLSRFGNA